MNNIINKLHCSTDWKQCMKLNLYLKEDVNNQMNTILLNMKLLLTKARTNFTNGHMNHLSELRAISKLDECLIQLHIQLKQITVDILNKNKFELNNDLQLLHKLIQKGSYNLCM